MLLRSPRRPPRGPGELRVGLDLVEVEQVAAAVEAHGERYLRRLFTSHERASCTGEPEVAARALAARFAAKEAALKVLRPEGVAPAWTDIEVLRAPGGWCTLRFTGAAAALQKSHGLVDVALSLTHEGGTAAAVVVGWARR